MIYSSSCAAPAWLVAPLPEIWHDRLRMETQDVQAELERLRKENEVLRQGQRAAGSLSLKVSEKGALSVYGLGRFPVTLYREQWAKLLAAAEEIKKFIADNEASLKRKES